MSERTYASTFCNFNHRMSDGKPIGHECYVIDSRLLEAELATGEWPEAIAEEWRKSRVLHRGVRAR